MWGKLDINISPPIAKQNDDYVNNGDFLTSIGMNSAFQISKIWQDQVSETVHSRDSHTDLKEKYTIYIYLMLGWTFA